jgi:hypothetical protein
MRSAALIFISLYYLATCTGIQLNIHFCSSEFDGITFFEKAKCCCDGKPAKKRCCSDQESFIKISDAHHFSKYELVSPDWFKTITFYTIQNQYSFSTFISTLILENKDGPPLWYSSELNILQRVLRL